MTIETARRSKMNRLQDLRHLFQRIRDIKMESHFGSVFYFALCPDVPRSGLNSFVRIRPCHAILYDCPVGKDLPVDDPIQNLLSGSVIRTDCRP